MRDLEQGDLIYRSRVLHQRPASSSCLNEEPPSIADSTTPQVIARVLSQKKGGPLSRHLDGPAFIRTRRPLVSNAVGARGRVADAGAHRRGSGFVGTQRCIGEGPCGRSELLVAPGHEIFGVLDGAAEVEQGHVPEISGAEDAFSVGVGSELVAERVGAELIGVRAGGMQERKNAAGGY
ncbi:MAG: hypothetical protein HW422_196 [Cutibacterium acnes]|nr:hypothetical protein [Cutibacterium acnes]